MSRRSARAFGARAEAPRNTAPWWQVIMPVSRQCNPTRWKYERIIKHVMAPDADEALALALRMLMESQTIISPPHVHQRTERFMDRPGI